MSIAREMKALYQSLQVGLEKEFPKEREWIDQALTDDLIRNNLEFRTKVAELVGLIKFFNNLPIFVPEVEQKILEGIKFSSSARNLNSMLTTSFFKLVMEHSKAVQTRLCELLQGKRDEAKKMLDDSVSSIKQSSPQNAKQLDEVTLAKEGLQPCRGLIQNATDSVLDEMVVVSKKVASNRDHLLELKSDDKNWVSERKKCFGFIKNEKQQNDVFKDDLNLRQKYEKTKPIMSILLAEHSLWSRYNRYEANRIALQQDKKEHDQCYALVPYARK